MRCPLRSSGRPGAVLDSPNRRNEVIAIVADSEGRLENDSNASAAAGPLATVRLVAERLGNGRVRSFTRAPTPDVQITLVVNQMRRTRRRTLEASRRGIFCGGGINRCETGIERGMRNMQMLQS